jgi:hypothetical protein
MKKIVVHSKTMPFFTSEISHFLPTPVIQLSWCFSHPGGGRDEKLYFIQTSDEIGYTCTRYIFVCYETCTKVLKVLFVWWSTNVDDIGIEGLHIIQNWGLDLIKKMKGTEWQNVCKRQTLL